MSRIACSLVLLAASSAAAADLPAGAVARLGDNRFRAGGAVHHLALSPDGKQFATTRAVSDESLTVAVWDADTGRPLHAHAVNRELFAGLVWGPGGAFAVIRGTEPGEKGKPWKVSANDFRVWDFTDPKAAPPLLPPRGVVERTHGGILDGPPKTRPKYTAFHFSGNGSRLAAEWQSADGKFTVHVFELKPVGSAAKLTRAGTLDFGAEPVGAVRLSADGKSLVVFRALNEPARNGRGDELTATVWDVARGKPEKPVLVSLASGSRPVVIDMPERIGGRLMLAPDARTLVVHASGEKEWGFDALPLALPLALPYKSPPQPRQRVRWPNPEAEPRDGGGYAFFPSGKVLAVAAERNTFILDIVTGKELGRLEGHADTPDAVAVSADGARIATADGSGLVRLWDAKTFHPLHDASGHRAPVEHAELSPDGKRLLTWAPDETVRLWDVATGKELRAFAGAPGLGRFGSRGNRPTFTPDGTAILFSTKDRLAARDLLTGLEVPLPGDLAKSKPRYAVFAPDGTAVLTWADDDPPLAVYDWPGGKKRFELDTDGPVQPANFSPDGTAVLADVCAPKRWDAKTGKELPPAWADNRSDDLWPLVALRPNSLLLVRGPRGESPRVVEAGSGEPVARFRLGRASEDPSFASSGIALSPAGGQFAASRHRHPSAALFEAATQTVRRELRGHRGEVRVLGFTPDGTKLLTAGGDHTVLVWDVRLQAVPLPDAIKKETNAAKLWEMLATGKAPDAYLAMARLSREPDAALKLAKMKLKPAAKGDRETDATNLTDARAVELLDALDARALLKELAGGHTDAFRTQEAKRALQRREANGYNPREK